MPSKNQLPPHEAPSIPPSPSPSPNDLSKVETNASALYDTLPTYHKALIVFTTSWSTLAACFSSTSLLSAAVEIAADLNTTPEVINLSTGGLMLAMGCSSFVWSPLSSIFGRQLAYRSCMAVLMAFLVGAATARSTVAFVVLRVLGGFQGTFFHVAGQTIIAEYFPPTQRGMATGFFMAGTVLGPPLGPCVAAIMIEFANWRSIIWLQVAMCGLGLLLSFFFIPPSRLDRGMFKMNMTGRTALAQFNPLPVFKTMVYPNVFFAQLSCGLLSWSQSSILATPREVLTSKFNITSPLIAGLFYFAPASGFLFGAIVGGRYSDMTVRKWIAIRGGLRLPQDRLKSGMFGFFFLIPVATLIYGWGLEKCHACTRERAGLALPIVTVWFAGVGIMQVFSSLNTYCAEAIPKRRREVMVGKYLLQYIAGACATSGAVPLMEAVGVGWSSTIAVVLALVAGSLTLCGAMYGLTMQTWVEERIHGKKDVEKTKSIHWPTSTRWFVTHAEV
ncbi:MFS general substrate transporter [Aaosphaeria arxii CBS 175.79]|uniref:MFS general substrate transporter n=1 Tax=Aaosphaeria arxii CBS 175.79 TaxID=1450172 RepID=A0A6A5XQS2_9PLEO|nr:MFS general substrate transporter [Aaosphaeria arxii CBS 175.79]KAF2015283.1 MFS general substrate transporter [Aaosphaeria arxii CBS 175.79]